MQEFYEKTVTSYDLLKKITKNCSKKESYELKNILERFLILKENNFDLNDILIKAGKEMAEKNIKNIGEKLKLIKNCKKKILKKEEYKFINNTFLIGKVKQIILEDKFNDFLKKNISKEKIGEMILRYKALLPGSQQWAVPREVFNKISLNFNLNIEGFASPLNARSENYCSLFKEDNIFGSISSFFDLDLEEKRIIANPPFIPFIMEKIVLKICEFLNKEEEEEKETFIVLNFPYWSDANFIQKLKEFQKENVFVQYFTFEKEKHYYEGENNEKIIAKFDSIFFVLIKNPKKDYDLTIFDKLY